MNAIGPPHIIKRATIIPLVVPPSCKNPKRNPDNMYNQLFHFFRSKPFPILHAATTRRPRLSKFVKAFIGIIFVKKFIGNN